jgi:hypothetical protein
MPVAMSIPGADDPDHQTLGSEVCMSFITTYQPINFW